MEFGVFDHIDRDGQALRDFYATRLRIVEHCERAGFTAYHIAEHHGTPLGLAPSPGLFLSAAIQRTTRMRLGPLVFPFLILVGAPMALGAFGGSRLTVIQPGLLMAAALGAMVLGALFGAVAGSMLGGRRQQA